MAYRVVFSLLCLSCNLNLQASTVDSIVTENARTPNKIIQQFFDTREGEEFNQERWKTDIQRLRNTELFYDVNYHIEELVDNKIKLTVQASNKHSLIPIFKYKAGGGTSLFTVGAYEVNLFNKLLEAGAQYENVNGLDGGVIWFRHPYWFSYRNQLGAELYIQTLNLPLLTPNGKEQAKFDNGERRFNARILHELRSDLRLGFGVSVYSNEFVLDNSTPERTERNAAFLTQKPLRQGRTVSLIPKGILGQVNRNEFRVYGQELTLQGEFAHSTIGSEFDFALAEVKWLGAWLPSSRLNIAAQAQLGTKTGHELQHKFYLGGLDTVRGFLDGQFRGDHYWLTNLEMRPTLSQHSIVVLQGNFFIDVAKTWDEQSFSEAGFEDPSISLGAGIRAILPRVYRATIRLDVARTIAPVQQTGVVFGLQQFF